MSTASIAEWLEGYKPRSWTGCVQMKSSMTFIRGNRRIAREKYTFKSREVKRLKECKLALSDNVFKILILQRYRLMSTFFKSLTNELEMLLSDFVLLISLLSLFTNIA